MPTFASDSSLSISRFSTTLAEETTNRNFKSINMSDKKTSKTYTYITKTYFKIKPIVCVQFVIIVMEYKFTLNASQNK